MSSIEEVEEVKSEAIEPIDYASMVKDGRDPRLLAETMRFIIHKGGAAKRNDVRGHLSETFSFDNKMLEKNKSGIVKWWSTYQFNLIGLGKAKILRRTGGNWRVTDEGRKYAFLPPEKLQETTRSGYRDWKIADSASVNNWRITANNDWDKFRNESMIACGWRTVGDIEKISATDLENIVKKEKAAGRSISRSAVMQLIYIRDMPIGATVIATDNPTQTIKAIGRVTGPYFYVEDDPLAHRRAVEWLDIKDRTAGGQKWKARVQSLPDDFLDQLHGLVVDTRQRKFWALTVDDDDRRLAEFQSEHYVGSGFRLAESAHGLQEDVSGWPEDDIAEAMRTADPDGTAKPASTAASLFQFSNVAKNSDLIVVKHGQNSVLGVCEIVDDYECDEADEIAPHRRNVRWLSTSRYESPWPFARNIFVDIGEDDTSLRNLLRASSDWEKLRDALEWAPDDTSDPDDILERRIADNSFLDIDETKEILSLLRSKRNLILQGAPGTGKTYLARQIARTLASTGSDADRQWKLVQFHQSYGYEDFIEGYRPDSDGNFRIKDGVFKLFCRRAASDPDSKYVFVIDEINRGNLSRIFGELMVLLEHDKRGPEFSMNLAYSGEDGGSFYVPKNVFILGLMNTADRSLAVVDYALRRRFAFYALMPRYNSKDFKNHLVSKGVSDTCIERINSTMTELNAAIAESRALGSGFVIGHSFFCPRESSISDGDQWIARVMQYEIKPLLEEYCGSQQKLLERLVSIVSS